MSNIKNIGKVSCYNCGATLEKAQLVVVIETPLALVAHATCSECGAQSMVTMTPSGVGSVPLVSDLEPKEIKKFINMEPISYDEILDLHKKLKKTTICNIMQKKEKPLKKKKKASEKNAKSQQ